MKADDKQRLAAFRKAVRQHLKPLTPRLVAVLKKLVKHPFPRDFWQLDFEIHEEIHEFDSGFPVCVYYYRKGFDQVMEGDEGSDQYPFQIPVTLLRTRRVYPASLRKKFTASGDEEYWHDLAACAELIEWFHRCWRTAGGKKFSFRARIARHDTSRRFDLVKARWVRDL